MDYKVNPKTKFLRVKPRMTFTKFLKALVGPLLFIALLVIGFWIVH